MNQVVTPVQQGFTGMEAMWMSVLAFVPRFIGFLVILIIGYFVAMFLGKAVDKLLEKVGFDRAVERSGMRKALAKTDINPSDILGKVAFYTIFLFVLQMAFGVFGPNPISDLLAGVIAFLPNIFVAIVITVLAASIAAAVRDIVMSSLGGLSYGRFLANAAGLAIVTIGVFAALTQLNIAPEIVLGLYYAMLAIIVGVAVVAVGGGGIGPMRNRWENALSVAEREVPRMQREVENSRGGTGTTGADAMLDQPTMRLNPPVDDEDRRGYLG
jgi:hypothetical protein